jgi:diacylglycerol kinase
MGFYFQITTTEWIVILVISAVVLALEMVNSSIERLCDLYTTDKHKEIAKIKDISAGAVLVAAFFAAVIGTIIFYKYLFIS